MMNPEKKKHSPISDVPASTDEAALLADVLMGSDEAWRRFVKQYEPLLRDVVHQATADHSLSKSEMDDILGEFWMAVITNNMRLLRSFNPSRGSTLLTWLTFHVAGIASDHIAKRAEEPTFVPLEEARNVAAPGMIDLRAEILAALDSPAFRRELAKLVRSTIREEAPAPVDEGFIDANSAADLLGMSVDAVRKAAFRGSLPCRRVGRKLRFVRSELFAVAKPGLKRNPTR
jgi:DNA-directed RNA polymerase specialized sigma24 family protein